METGDGGGPLVSVITVNHNGAHLLGELLRSLDHQSYRNHEVIVVDNASTDDSVETVGRDFPHVRTLGLSENLGFAGGNNAGIRAARGDLIALINNDTVADRHWLEAMVATAQADHRIAAVSSKIVFLRPFLPIRLSVETVRPADGDDCRDLGALFGEDSGFADSDYEKVVFKQGFYAPEPHGDRSVRWTMGDATVYLPVRDTTGSAVLHLVIGGGGLPVARPLDVFVGEHRLARLDLDQPLGEHVLEVPAAVVASESFDLINNAGTALSSAGNAADLGIYEPDRGQFDSEADVEAFCGAAVLLRRSALDRAGLFDRDFFMYYEDTDLSWRLRSLGYRLRYQPKSRVRHIHASTSVEWSPLFVFHTARNKILMIAKNGGLLALLRAYARELVETLRLLKQRFGRGSGNEARARLATHLRVHRSLLKHLPRALLKRAALMEH